MSGSSVIGTLSLVAVDPMENLIRDLPGPKYGDLRDRDLQHLATAILEIKRAYRLLASGFRTFDEEATRRQLKYPEGMGPLAPRWNALSQVSLPHNPRRFLEVLTWTFFRTAFHGPC